MEHTATCVPAHSRGNQNECSFCWTNRLSTTHGRGSVMAAGGRRWLRYFLFSSEGRRVVAYAILTKGRFGPNVGALGPAQHRT